MNKLCAFITTLLLAPIVLSAALNHADWTEILQEFSKDGMVDYAGLKAQPDKLESYLADIAELSKADFESQAESEQLATLINLYNAATVKLIIDHYPVESIEDVGWFHGAFRRRFINFLGKKHSLNDIEHGIIRVDYDEPRIHFAVVCAAMSCPRLASEAYTGAQLDAQLERQGFAFLGEAALNRLDHANRQAYMSSIFKWYGSDFEKSGGSYFDAIRKYWPAADRVQLGKQDYSIRYLTYDWSLNEWKR